MISVLCIIAPTISFGDKNKINNTTSVLDVCLITPTVAFSNKNKIYSTISVLQSCISIARTMSFCDKNKIYSTTSELYLIAPTMPLVTKQQHDLSTIPNCSHNGIKWQNKIYSTNSVLQEVFHVYLNKFENAVTRLILVILGNNWFPKASRISRNTQSSRK